MREQDEFEDGPRRIIPALPMEDPALGEIRWGRWERALPMFICLAGGGQADTDCETCAWPTLRTTHGKTLHTPEPSMVRIARSTQTRDGRSKWQRRVHTPYWCYTHWAQYCPRCDEMYAWRRVDAQGRREEWTEIFHHPPTTERALPPAEGTLF